MSSFRSKLKTLREDIREAKKAHKSGKLRKELENQIKQGNDTAFALHYLLYRKQYKYFKKGKSTYMKLKKTSKSKTKSYRQKKKHLKHKRRR